MLPVEIKFLTRDEFKLLRVGQRVTFVDTVYAVATPYQNENTSTGEPYVYFDTVSRGPNIRLFWEPNRFMLVGSTTTAQETDMNKLFDVRVIVKDENGNAVGTAWQGEVIAKDTAQARDLGIVKAATAASNPLDLTSAYEVKVTQVSA